MLIYIYMLIYVNSCFSCVNLYEISSKDTSKRLESGSIKWTSICCTVCSRFDCNLRMSHLFWGCHNTKNHHITHNNYINNSLLEMFEEVVTTSYSTQLPGYLMLPDVASIVPSNLTQNGLRMAKHQCWYETYASLHCYPSSKGPNWGSGSGCANSCFSI